MSEHLDRLQREHAPVLSHDEAVAYGRGLRRETERRSHASYEQSDRDPLAILAEQNATRLGDLVPLRMGRMLANPFAFYRGTAAIMAADLARGPDTGVRIVACGDAHISNFGLFASPQRTMVFDLNDFDEAGVAPWEWDLKRMVASVVIGAREVGFDESAVRETALRAASAYRETLREMMELDVLERYYFRTSTDNPRQKLGPGAQKVLDRAIRQAQKRTSSSYMEKISTRAPDGTRTLVERPPVLVHLPIEDETMVEAWFERYRNSVSPDIAFLLSHFRLSDIARRVVGVGSVGTRCFILILTGPRQEPLILQIKEAPQSVLETYGGMPGFGEPRDDDYSRQGHRVVSNQRILQAVSDPFLGHVRVNGRDFSVRQFRDRKGSIAVEGLGLAEFVTYVNACGTILARSHAQSPGAASIAGYLGKSDAMDRAVVEWGVAYAQQSLADYGRLRQAVDDGLIEAQREPS